MSIAGIRTWLRVGYAITRIRSSSWRILDKRDSIAGRGSTGASIRVAGPGIGSAVIRIRGSGRRRLDQRDSIIGAYPRGRGSGRRMLDMRDSIAGAHPRGRGIKIVGAEAGPGASSAVACRRLAALDDRTYVVT
jgi:hypothetical protein